MKSIPAHRKATRQFRAEEFYTSKPDDWLVQIVIPRVCAIVAMAIAAVIVLAIGAVWGWLDGVLRGAL